jgi:hypothetical protein
MLDPWIIEEIRRREERKRRIEQRQPVLELPLPDCDRDDHEVREDKEEPRGVVVIEFCV